ncbi:MULTISPECIES: class I SAM-dependent methyltransferase [Rhodopseudomonas]|uniref:Methyltransferase n=1 Tax=Rhodopseudomonas palustris TaxID=1076 RepID=A0A0D7F1T1_RHOPL|nr:MULTISPECIES: class I SAM-dependent methyltransferase [Rhodopseudomonas]KIZ47029.1 methyltransferase [Rhodopseudomonas palustris]MDF3813994.1 class I SAM-dependent methyltransferase [Rhodopseudomonas sp. BAL398]WOK19954.1 class I SAM-dependent methyltransferase [Rhodopseudomonas sp. BAL398]
MPTVDRQYYQVVRPGGLIEATLVAARDKIFADFMTFMNPSADTTLIDVGVSDVVSEAANVLERKYPWQNMITACGLGEGVDFSEAFPAVRYRQIEPNIRLPFDDLSFDIATSNAVLEHVGSSDNQKNFVRELRRVARRVFITVPNRFFPIEHHTSIPIVHYTNSGFRLACAALGKTAWTDPANLILMSKSRLQDISKSVDGKKSIGYTGLRIGPLSSNLFLAIT